MGLRQSGLVHKADFDGYSGFIFATRCHPLRWQSLYNHIACKSLKNNEIQSFEVANHGFVIVATFLHTRSFNILRRLGSGVKRKSSENQ